MSFMGAPSSCGSSHGREALLGDQLAIRHQHHVPGLHGPGESLCSERIRRRRGGIENRVREERKEEKKCDGPSRTTDVLCNQVTAQCHTAALLPRSESTSAGQRG